jgi:hypothetical protein
MIPFSEFAHRYRQLLDEKSHELAAPLIAGEAKTFEDYRQQAGAIHGLRIAREEFDNFVKRANDGHE